MTCPDCAELRDQVAALERDLRAKRSEITKLRNQLAGPGPTDEARQAARRLFDYWRERCHHEQAKLTPDRERKVLARLRDGYTEEFIRRAIDGAAAAPFRNNHGRPFDDLELICRNGSKLENFAQRAAPPGDSGLRHKLVGV